MAAPWTHHQLLFFRLIGESSKKGLLGCGLITNKHVFEICGLRMSKDVLLMDRCFGMEVWLENTQCMSWLSENWLQPTKQT
jgi:hypothetical protein